MASLAERLGYSSADRILIVNCDDVGSSHGANVASAAAMRKGWASSATLMVPCPWAQEAVAMFAGLDVGVHLTLTAEYLGYRWRSLTGAKSLHDEDGFLPLTAQEVWANAKLAEVEAECRAQIEQALAWGVDVTHIDNRMGTMQMDSRYYPILLKLAVEFDLPLRMAGASEEKRLGFSCREPARSAGRVFPDTFVLQMGTADPGRASRVSAEATPRASRNCACIRSSMGQSCRATTGHRGTSAATTMHVSWTKSCAA